MPPARPRAALDDVRSEASLVLTTHKDRILPTTTIARTKKTTSTNTAIIPSSSHVTTAIASNVQEPAHVDWHAVALSDLHAYRSAYRLAISPAYSMPYAELLYKSHAVGLRAPSQVLARRKLRELKDYRKQQQQARANPDSSRNQRMAGLSKVHKRVKEEAASTSSKRASRERERPNQDVEMIHPSIERHTPNSASDHATNTPNNTGASTQFPLLNPTNPEETLIGQQSRAQLSTAIRKHFNDQNLTEPETIARFTYCVRQSGSPVMTNTTKPLAQRYNMLPAPDGGIGTKGSVSYVDLNSTTNMGSGPAAASGSGSSLAAGHAKGGTHSALHTNGTSTLGGNQLYSIGGYGDGRGKIMSQTSCGREIGLGSDAGAGLGGGGSTFRKRFRPKIGVD